MSERAIDYLPVFFRRFVPHEHDFDKHREIPGHDYNPLGTIIWRCNVCGTTRRTPLSRANPLTGKDPADYQDGDCDD